MDCPDCRGKGKREIEIRFHEVFDGWGSFLREWMRYRKSGRLPVRGELEDQPAVWMDAADYLDMRLHEAEERKRENEAKMKAAADRKPRPGRR